MKKLLPFAAFIFSVVIVGAQDGALFKVSMLIEDDLFGNKMEISEYAKSLTENERRIVYDDYKQDPTVAVIENVFIGCGLGSFLQGDSRSGWIGLFGDLGGLSLTIYGTTQFYDDAYSDPDGFYDLFDSKGFRCLMLGTVIVLATRIFEMIQPIRYADDYNKTLRAALDSGRVSFNIVPTMEPASTRFGLAMKISLR